MSCLRPLLPLIVLLALWPAVAASQTDPPRERPQILAHYMPWFSAPPVSPQWGWHWTMNAFDPDQRVDGRPAIAAHVHPLAGPYDSGDPDALEYHLLLMKVAGIDGVIVDWYGLEPFRDYPLLHRNTQQLVEAVERLGLVFAICYEDQTIPALVEAGRLQPELRVDHARKEIRWLAEQWFSRPSYLRLDERPVLLSFGQTGLTDEEWTRCLTDFQPDVAYFSQHHRRESAVGAFDWPVPTAGLDAVEQFHRRSREWPQSLPVVFPRFVDIYAQAGVGESYGRVDDHEGETFRRTLQQALESEARLIQIATWNDWGEGTVVEPSHEYGYRDLEALQTARRDADPAFPFVASDLRLPARLLAERRSASTPAEVSRLDQLSTQLAAGELETPRKVLHGSR